VSRSDVRRERHAGLHEPINEVSPRQLSAPR
jgi:hypothetical protein